VHLSKEKEEKLGGDKLRELILLVYFNNKYDKNKNKISWLKENLGYSTGGLYNALDNSGYFERKADEINLTQKGTNYLKTQILPKYTAFYPVGNFLIILGIVFLWQWLLWTYANTPVIIPWYSATMVIVGGTIIRFFLMRLNYWIMRNRKSN
jgi:hypothetical protein